MYRNMRAFFKPGMRSVECIPLECRSQSPVNAYLFEFGTALERMLEQPEKIHTMNPFEDRAKKLTEVATRMMMAGNVNRYLHALRLLFALRARTVVAA